ncbi:MAG: SpaH/EbpB family LPXTG-anchored major pilin [Lachnospiraceae bacterium]|nr:SpaH/EbpB family LPXTG-anchored major pilin [Lachnospiraceae bacterium]
MKRTRRMLALVLAFVLCMAMGTTALATQTVTPAKDRTKETDGSISVSDPVQGQTYTLYILFKADMGQGDAITYTANGIDLTGNKWFELNSNGFVVAKDGVTTDWAKDPEAITWAKSVGTPVGNPIKAGDNVVWDGLEYGYYFVETTLGSFVAVDSANKTAAVHEKNEAPKVDKEITGVENGKTTLGIGDDASDPGEGKNEKAIAEIGDNVSFELTISAKPGAENYVVTDTLPEGLTPPAASGVIVSSGDGTYSVEVTGQVITVTFTKDYLDRITTPTNITITYDAVLNGNAVSGETGNENTVELKYGDDPDNKSTDSSKVFAAKIAVIKNDGNGRALPGAIFALKNSDGKYYSKDATTGDVTWVDKVENATKYTSGAEGTLDGEFTGLSDGSYVLEEVKAPDGYNEIDPDDPSLKITINEKEYDKTNLEKSTTVINNAGTELPSTGGMGTTLFYVIGGVLVIGAAVLLIAKRRMNDQ